MKLNIAICDDEQNQIKYVKDIVSEWAEVKKHISVLCKFHIFRYRNTIKVEFILLVTSSFEAKSPL